MKIVVTSFHNTMKKPQIFVGNIYLPLHIFVLPLFIGMLGMFLPSGLSDLAANAVYYGLGVVFCLTVMLRYLRTGFDILLDNFLKVLVDIAFCYIIFMMLNYAVALGMLMLLGDQFLNPNNQAVVDLASSDGISAAAGLSIFLAPLVEEVLFRGVLFGELRAKNRFLAYAVSIFVFAVYHVWQFALVSMDLSVFIFMLQYIPAGYALARCYEKTNSIWAPIFMHMIINVIAITALT